MDREASSGQMQLEQRVAWSNDDEVLQFDMEAVSLKAAAVAPATQPNCVNEASIVSIDTAFSLGAEMKNILS